MSVKVKASVTFTDPSDPSRLLISPAGFLIIEAFKAASKTLGVDLTITSGTDGAHSGPNDPHKRGAAYDLRTHDLAPDVKARLVGAIMAGLGWTHFVGFIEDPGGANEHAHFQPKKGTEFTVADYLAFDPSEKRAA